MMMDGGSIAEMLAKVGLHRGKDLRQNRRGGVIVEVNAAHAHCSILRWFTLDLPGCGGFCQIDRSGFVR